MTTTNNTAQIGTVSHGTTRPQDLIPCFLTDLEILSQESYFAMIRSMHARDRGVAYALAGKRYIGDDHPFWTEELCYEILSDLFDALSELAPSYCYFGSHPGDGSDYGFWPCFEAIDDACQDDMAKVGDLSELPDCYRGEVCIVNDRGNMTIGFVDDSGSFVESWAIV